MASFSFKNRKTQLILTAAVGITILLTGCGGSGKNSASNRKPLNSAGAQQLLNRKLCLVHRGEEADPRITLWGEAIKQAHPEITSQLSDLLVTPGQAVNRVKKEQCGIVLATDPALNQELLAWSDREPQRELVMLDEKLPVSASKNLSSLSFALSQPAFLAGYLTAGMTQTGKVAVLANDSAQQAWAQAFQKGISYYNRYKGSGVEIINWDLLNQQLNLKESGADPESVSRLQTAGADVIYVLDGRLPEATWQKIKDKKTLLIGVNLAGATGNALRTSQILANTIINPQTQLSKLAEAIKTGTTFNIFERGDLANGGVAFVLAPQNKKLISAELQQEIQELEQQIKTGKLKLSDLTFNK